MIRILFIATLATTLGYPCPACPHIGLEYTAEMQTDFNNRYNWVNLLRLDFSQPAGKHLALQVSTISIAKTRQERLAHDWQTFSNIEEQNLTLAISVAGITWKEGRSSLFLGIRNLNEDYFTTPVTSVFTNSSCGIFPTLSANVPIANYPLSSTGIHYVFNSDTWQIQASCYNGQGYNRFTGRENVFRFCPSSDGVFGITSILYTFHGSNYLLGSSLHWGLPIPDEKSSNEPIPSASTPTEIRKRVTSSLWGYAEQQLGPSLHALLQYAISPSPGSRCKQYAGIGLVWHNPKFEAGIFSDCARFVQGDEWATEATVRIACTEKVSIQPVFHLITNTSSTYCIGAIRLCYTL